MGRTPLPKTQALRAAVRACLVKALETGTEPLTVHEIATFVSGDSAHPFTVHQQVYSYLRTLVSEGLATRTDGPGLHLYEAAGALARPDPAIFELPPLEVIADGDRNAAPPKPTGTPRAVHDERRLIDGLRARLRLELRRPPREPKVVHWIEPAAYAGTLARAMANDIRTPDGITIITLRAQCGTVIVDDGAEPRLRYRIADTEAVNCQRCRIR